jgi:hypothetical protein
MCALYCKVPFRRVIQTRYEIARDAGDAVRTT